MINTKVNIKRVLLTSILLFILIMSKSMASEKKTNITVSTTILYNCKVIDINNKKYCDNVEVKQEKNQITIKY